VEGIVADFSAFEKGPPDGDFGVFGRLADDLRNAPLNALILLQPG
jgi:hypothetical protein